MNIGGIDCGAKNTTVVILKDNEVLAEVSVLTGFNQNETAEKALNQALKKAGLSRENLEHITVTGTGKDEVKFANSTVSEVKADAKGATFLFPSVRTLIDVGAEEGRAIKINEKGKVMDFAVNEKCAAGAGTFTETMARALEIKLEKMGALSLKSQKKVPMNAQCAVFAESEVVSLIHNKYSKEDIAHAVHDAIADRIASMTRKIGIEKEIVLIGGVAKNIGFVDSLKKNLKLDLLIPKDPEFTGALGAALVAAEKIEGG